MPQAPPFNIPGVCNRPPLATFPSDDLFADVTSEKSQTAIATTHTFSSTQWLLHFHQSLHLLSRKTALASSPDRRSNPATKPGADEASHAAKAVTALRCVIQMGTIFVCNYGKYRLPSGEEVELPRRALANAICLTQVFDLKKPYSTTEQLKRSTNFGDVPSLPSLRSRGSIVGRSDISLASNTHGSTLGLAAAPGSLSPGSSKSSVSSKGSIPRTARRSSYDIHNMRSTENARQPPGSIQGTRRLGNSVGSSLNLQTARPKNEEPKNLLMTSSVTLKFSTPSLNQIMGHSQTMPKIYVMEADCLEGEHRSLPGGGYRKGNYGQEEQVCRRSNLWECLDDPYSRRGPLTQWKFPLPDTACIIAPHVYVFRESEKKGYGFMGEPFKLTIVTSSPPINPHPEQPLDPRVARSLSKKIESALTVCIRENIRVVVLGSYGCGAHRNPPKDVARIFHQLIQKLSKDSADTNGKPCFELVCFACLDDPSRPSGCVGAFLEEFRCPLTTWKDVEAMEQLASVVDDAEAVVRHSEATPNSENRGGM
ncbi:uncharacterized protein BJ171DRAFT_581744 [Polychytrium aggregatum]|uniref:uncharacterized protein n=1 Tax=Polychytrium aggregatum TaxID=110093 RepID=UPI0022FDF35B|nr:uncharacterized protein BJ171DRAFT_581744 [Polychytrium aggregatum]KAI9204592.1 hypothetical protein BJ171DRAFT_581744 [Polychytrium aggregatum]